jgi:CheY-like chemotaxis protein
LIQKLESSFRIYPEFVGGVLAALPGVERRIAELEALIQATAEGKAASDEMNALLNRFEDELRSTRAAAESATRELSTLKRELQFARSEVGSKESTIETLRREIEGMKAVETAPVERRSTRAPVSNRPKLPAKRVLLIDDAEVNRVLISHYLKGLPVELDFAPSLEEGERLGLTARYDLILIDLGLIGAGDNPHWLRLREAASAVPFFGLGEPGQETAQSSSGLRAILTKALPKETIIERLSKNLWSEETQKSE